MIVGLLSDTHDRLDMLARALEAFRARGASLVLHAGDWCAPFTVEALNRAGIPYHGIFGNNDGDRLLLHARSEGRIGRAGTVVELGAGWRALLLHEPDNVEVLAAAGFFRLIIHGHDHRPRVEELGSTLVVDPGECCGWLSGKPTAALLDTSSGLAEIIALRS